MQRTKLSLVLMFCVFFMACTIQKTCKDCGVAYQRTRLFKPEQNDYILPAYERDIKYLFYDSMMIAERHKLFIETSEKGKETWRRDVVGYQFVDFRTKSFYYYNNFSDTASIVWANRQPASLWIYFGDPRIMQGSFSLPDTSLDGVKYSRLQGFFTKNGDTTLIETMYYLPEVERPIAYYGKTIVNGRLVSVVRLDDLDVPSGLKTYSSMDITSTSLTKEELKVFAAWKKNAEEHPLPK